METFDNIIPYYRLNGELVPSEMELVFSKTKILISYDEFLQLSKILNIVKSKILSKSIELKRQIDEQERKNASLV